MFPQFSSRYVLHPHKLHHNKKPHTGSSQAPVAIPTPIIYAGLSSQEVKHMRWGIEVQMEGVLHQAKANRSNWHRAIVDAKELNLRLEKLITANVETGTDLRNNLKRDAEEFGERNFNKVKGKASLEEIARKNSMKKFWGTEKVDKAKFNFKEINQNCSSKTSGFAGTKTAGPVESNAKHRAKSPRLDENNPNFPDELAYLEAFGNTSIQDFRQILGPKCAHWTDKELEKFQYVVKMSTINRKAVCKAAQNACSASNAAAITNGKLFTVSKLTPQNQVPSVSNRNGGKAKTGKIPPTPIPELQVLGDHLKANASEPPQPSTSDIMFTGDSAAPGAREGKIEANFDSPLLDDEIIKETEKTLAKNVKSNESDEIEDENHSSSRIKTVGGFKTQYVEIDTNKHHFELATLCNVQAPPKDKKSAAQKVLSDARARLIADMTERPNPFAPNIPKDDENPWQYCSIDSSIFKNLAPADMSWVTGTSSSEAIDEDEKERKELECRYAAAKCEKRKLEDRGRAQRAEIRHLEGDLTTAMTDLVVSPNEFTAALDVATTPTAISDAQNPARSTSSNIAPATSTDPEQDRLLTKAADRKKRLSQQYELERDRVLGGRPEPTQPPVLSNIEGYQDITAASNTMAGLHAPENASIRPHPMIVQADIPPALVINKGKQVDHQAAASRGNASQIDFQYAPEQNHGRSEGDATPNPIFYRNGKKYLDVGKVPVVVTAGKPFTTPQGHVCQPCQAAPTRGAIEQTPRRYLLTKMTDGTQAAGSATAYKAPGSHLTLDPFYGVRPPRPCLEARPVPQDPMSSKTEAQELAAIDTDVEAFKASMHERKQRLALDVQFQIKNGYDSVTGITAEKWKSEEERLNLQIDLRSEQYRLMLIAGRRWDRGETNLPGLGEEAQEHLQFLDCDQAEQIRRAGNARKVREENFAEYLLKPSSYPYDFTETRKHPSEFSPEDLEEKAAYHAEYQAALAAGCITNAGADPLASFDPTLCSTDGHVHTTEGCLAAKKGCSRRYDKAQVTDTAEEQIRCRQEAREKQEAERRRLIAERESAKEVREAKNAVARTGGGKKKNKGKGRKGKK